MLKKVASLACGAIVAASSIAAAQQVVQEPSTATVAAAGVTLPSHRVSQILGSSVQLQGGAGFGKVQDIILSDAGAVEYVVVAREGNVALFPWNGATVNNGTRVMTYDVAPQVVQPLFVPAATFPTAVNPGYVERVGKVFGPRVLRREIRRGAVVPVVPVQPVP